MVVWLLCYSFYALCNLLPLSFYFYLSTRNSLKWISGDFSTFLSLSSFLFSHFFVLLTIITENINIIISKGVPIPIVEYIILILSWFVSFSSIVFVSLIISFSVLPFCNVCLFAVSLYLLCIMSSMQHSLLVVVDSLVLTVPSHNLSMFRFSVCNVRFAIFPFIPCSPIIQISVVLTMHPGCSVITPVPFIVSVLYTS
jgi:hypothetical protein